MTRRRTAVAAGMLLLSLAACGTSGGDSDAGSADDPLVITGSTTVEPIMTIAVRESRVDADIEAVGTIDGLRQFCEGEADLANASAPMPGPDGVEDLVGLCERNGVEYVEVPVGLDAIAVVRHADNDAVTDVTLDDLARIWAADSEVERWSDVREEWPDEPLTLYARGDGSGTFTGFAEQLLGDSEAVRDDYTDVEGSGELTAALAEDPGGLGVMGVGTYLAATEVAERSITTVTVDGVEPDIRSSAEGAYAFARPLLVYASLESLGDDDRVDTLLTHLLERGDTIVPRAFFYPLDETAYDEAQQRLEDRVTGLDASPTEISSNG